MEALAEEPDLERFCSKCVSDPNLTKFCKRCRYEFCGHFASKWDFQFCAYCLHDLVLHDSIIRKDVVTKSLSGKKTFTRVMSARHLMFEGKDWMFAAKRVLDMSEEELGSTIEYHRTIFGALINEMEARKIARNKKNLSLIAKGSSLKIPSIKSGMYTDGTPMTIGTDSTTVTTTTIKRTRITATQTNSTAVALTSIIAIMKAQGLGEEQIKAKLLGMVGK